MATFTLPSTHTGEYQVTQIQYDSYSSRWSFSGYGYVDEGTLLKDAVAGDTIIFNVTDPPSASQHPEQGYDVECNVDTISGYTDLGIGWDGEVRFQFPNNKATFSEAEVNGTVTMTVTGKHEESEMGPVITVLEVVNGSAPVPPEPEPGEAVKVFSENAVQFLKGKVEAAKGQTKELTSADYNYPTNNPNRIAAWLLPAGIYYWKNASFGEKVITANNSRNFANSCGTLIVTQQDDVDRKVCIYAFFGAANPYTSTSIGITYSTNGGEVQRPLSVLNTSSVINNLTSTTTQYPLSANQGKVLKGLIDAIDVPDEFTYAEWNTLWA